MLIMLTKMDPKALMTISLCIAFFTISFIAWPLIYDYYLVHFRHAIIITNKDHARRLSSFDALKLHISLSYVSINALSNDVSEGIHLMPSVLSGLGQDGVTENIDGHNTECSMGGPIYLKKQPSFFKWPLYLLISNSSKCIKYIKGGNVDKTYIMPTYEYKSETKEAKDSSMEDMIAAYIRFIVMTIPTDEYAVLHSREIYALLERAGLSINASKYIIEDETDNAIGCVKIKCGNKRYNYSRVKSSGIVIFNKDNKCVVMGPSMAIYNK